MAAVYQNVYYDEDPTATAPLATISEATTARTVRTDRNVNFVRFRVGGKEMILGSHVYFLPFCSTRDKVVASDFVGGCALIENAFFFCAPSEMHAKSKGASSLFQASEESKVE